MATMHHEPLGPYRLADQSRYFGGWITPAGDRDSILMAFPDEGWKHSAAVQLRQRADGGIEGTVHGDGDPDAAWRQALAVLSLDVDGGGYPAVGDRDPVIGALQREHSFLRPVLFHSPYEAACAFVIGHRMRIVQGRAIRARMAAEHGESFTVAGATIHAFPAPQRLLAVTTIDGVADEKVSRLHGIARAALDGRLDRVRLRSLPVDEALADVRQLRGIGEFFAAGIVLRGAGIVDATTFDGITRAGVRRFYHLDEEPSETRMAEITAPWRPYRMWCSVLVHASERRNRANPQ